MFATAGFTACAVTQSMPAMMSAYEPLPLAVEHPHRDQLDVLGHAVGGAADRAGDVRAVALAVVGVRVVVDEVPATHGPAAELPVRDADAAVEDVRGDVGRRGRGVRLRQRKAALVDAVQSPGRRGLVGARDGRVLLDVRDGRVGGEASGLARGHPGVEPAHGRRVGVGDLPAVPLNQPGAGLPLLEHHDVAVLDGVRGAGVEDDPGTRHGLCRHRGAADQAENAGGGAGEQCEASAQADVPLGWLRPTSPGGDRHAEDG
jgi:hypothetical protein